MTSDFARDAVHPLPPRRVERCGHGVDPHMRLWRSDLLPASRAQAATNESEYVKLASDPEHAHVSVRARDSPLSLPLPPPSFLPSRPTPPRGHCPARAAFGSRPRRTLAAPSSFPSPLTRTQRARSSRGGRRRGAPRVRRFVPLRAAPPPARRRRVPGARFLASLRPVSRWRPPLRFSSFPPVPTFAVAAPSERAAGGGRPRGVRHHRAREEPPVQGAPGHGGRRGTWGQCGGRGNCAGRESPAGR